MSLLVESKAYKPFRYPWAYDYWQKQQQVHWLGEEVPMGDDVKDWAVNLSADEQSFLTDISRFFTQADMDVSGGYIDLYLPKFKPVEIRMMLTSFANMETVHIAAYALLIETLGLPDSEFTAFLKYKEMVDKHEYLSNFNMDTERDTLRTMAVYGAFTEGLQLFASFAMLLNFPRFGKMKGMGQIVTWSVRDESLHTEGVIRLFHEYARETGAYDKSLREEIKQIAAEVVNLEDAFVDLVFADYKLQGITAFEIKEYVRFICDWRLQQLGITPLYGVKKHPLPWLKSILNGVEHGNFFETRPTEYSKGATTGTWAETWNKFDKRIDKG